ncbi:hypothetical protein HK103_000349 [Boothiomyces macroporosus]|uniref:Uncharacterized protein n=1 Tax=Boothiomyces macroporosus TaxID=261099 RepID=A0AAD5UFZ3_9FUNG|nr:hypothetical protein HK103_000349 [Boothiomyces macroporosus]
MSTGFLIPLVTLVNGIALSNLNYTNVRQLKAIPALLFTLLMCNIIYAFIVNILQLNYFTVNSIGYNSLLFVNNIVDCLATFSFEICYLVRLQAFVIGKSNQRYVWFLLVVPLFYSLVPIFGIINLFDPTVISASLFNSVFFWTNMVLAFSNLITHFVLCFLVVKLLSEKDENITIKVVLPGITSILFAVSCLLGILGITNGPAFIELCWALDVVSFMIVNQTIHRCMSGASNQKDVSTGSAAVERELTAAKLLEEGSKTSLKEIPQ